MDNRIGHVGLIKQVIFYIALLLLWQFIVALKIWPEYLLPAPISIGKTLLCGFSDHSFTIGIFTSLKRLCLGYGVSIIFGSILGVILFRYRTINDIMGRFILSLQTMPSICWFPLALLWFGLSELSIIFVVIAGSLFSITMTVNSSLRNMSPIILNVGRNFGAKKLNMLAWVMLPSVAPSLVMGFKQGWSFAWRSLMAGELIFNSLGLGFLLNMGRELNDMSRVIAVMFIIAAISILFDKLVFGRIEKFIQFRWGGIK
ncbi:MAG: ABC transporter permease [Candidatus Omnitrophica bacterium]|jgi:NitT/TauT family transport system permease protein|nr:ABC transporter permease [Candidatus Omnitrophota bacterium]